MASCVAIVGGVPGPRSARRLALSAADAPHSLERLGEQSADLRQAFLVDREQDAAGVGCGAVEAALRAGLRRLLEDLCEGPAQRPAAEAVGSPAHCSSSSQGRAVAR